MMIEESPKRFGHTARPTASGIQSDPDGSDSGKKKCVGRPDDVDEPLECCTVGRANPGSGQKIVARKGGSEVVDFVAADDPAQRIEKVSGYHG